MFGCLNLLEGIDVSWGSETVSLRFYDDIHLNKDTLTSLPLVGCTEDTVANFDLRNLNKWGSYHMVQISPYINLTSISPGDIFWWSCWYNHAMWRSITGWHDPMYQKYDLMVDLCTRLNHEIPRAEHEKKTWKPKVGNWWFARWFFRFYVVI